MHLDVLGSDRIAPTLIASWAKQSRFVPTYMQNSGTFRRDAGRNCFEAKSWARTIDLEVNELGWKSVFTKKFSEMTARRILALKVVYRNSMDRLLDAVRDAEENCRGLNTQKSKVVKNVFKNSNLEPPYSSAKKKQPTGLAHLR